MAADESDEYPVGAVNGRQDSLHLFDYILNNGNFSARQQMRS